MIRNVHTTTLRELVAQAEQDLAGYRRLLELAEREARVGQVLPDPLAPDPRMPLSVPWPAPDSGERREPYPTTTSVMPAIDGSTLPPSQEQAFGAFAADHAQHATSPGAVKEEQKWRQA